MQTDPQARIWEDWSVEDLPGGGTRLVRTVGTWVTSPAACLAVLSAIAFPLAAIAAFEMGQKGYIPEGPLGDPRLLLTAVVVVLALLMWECFTVDEFHLAPNLLMIRRLTFGLIARPLVYTGASLVLRRKMEDGKHTWSLVIEAAGSTCPLIATRSDLSRRPVRPRPLRDRAFLRHYPRLTGWLVRMFGNGEPYDLEELAALAGAIADMAGWPVRNWDVLAPVPDADSEPPPSATPGTDADLSP